MVERGTAQFLHVPFKHSVWPGTEGCGTSQSPALLRPGWDQALDLTPTSFQHQTEGKQHSREVWQTLRASESFRVQCGCDST